MWVRKAGGGTTVTHRRIQYEWPDDGSVTEVPDEFGAELLAIRGGGYSEAPEPVKSEEITEPGPDGEITEPGPVAGITEGEGQREPGEGDATGPDGDGGDGSEGDGGSPDGDPSEGDAKPDSAKTSRKSRAKAEDTGTPA